MVNHFKSTLVFTRVKIFNSTFGHAQDLPRDVPKITFFTEFPKGFLLKMLIFIMNSPES